MMRINEKWSSRVPPMKIFPGDKDYENELSKRRSDVKAEFDNDYKEAAEIAASLSDEELETNINDIYEDEWYETKSDLAEAEDEYIEYAQMEDYIDALYEGLYGTDPYFTAFIDEQRKRKS